MRWKKLIAGCWLLSAKLALAEGPPDEARRAATPTDGVSLIAIDEVRVQASPVEGDALEVREVRERSAADLGGALAEHGLASRVRRGAIGSDIVLRGFQRDAINTTIDGAQVAGACPNRMDPPAFHIDATEIGHVQVTRGPFDVTLPSVLGGAVRVVPRQAKAGLNAEGNLALYSNRHGEGSALAGYGHSRFDVLGSYAYKVAEPYLAGDGRPITGLYPSASANRYRSSATPLTAYAMQTVWGQAGMSFRPQRDRLQVAYTYQAAKDLLYPFLLMDAVYDDTHRVNLSYGAQGLGPFARVGAQAYFNRVDHSMNDARRCSASADAAQCNGGLPRSWSMQTQAHSQVFGGRVNGQLGKESPLSLGLDVFSRTWESITTRFNRMRQLYASESSIPDVTIVDAGLWMKHDRQLGPELGLSVGARVDVVHSRAARADAVAALFANYDAAGKAPELSALDILPGGNVQLAWRLAPTVDLWAGVGHAARSPDHQERYFALSGMPAMGAQAAKPGRIGRPDLRPMRNTELDLGFGYTTPRVVTKLRVFGALVTDAIVVAPTSGANGVPAVSYRNTAAKLAGGEASARAALPLDLFVTAALSSTTGWNASGDPLQEIPPFSGLAELRWDIGWVFAELQEQFAMRQRRVDARVNERATDGWTTTQLRVGFLIRELVLYAGVQNLFNRNYYEHLNFLRDPFASGIRVPEPGRTVYLSAQYAH